MRTGLLGGRPRSAIRTGAIAALACVLVATTHLAMAGGQPAVPTPVADPSPTDPAFSAPAYYRPVVSHGQAFPLARSNHLRLIDIEDNWHAPRLRLVGRKWELIGLHEGIDIYVEPGTPVVSMTPGTVSSAGWGFYSGNQITILGADGRSYFYAHLASIEPGIRPGARVLAGEVMGRSGDTGYGPPGERDQFPAHLHVGIQRGAEWVDPFGTLVSLYRVALAVDARRQAALDRLARAGDRAGWYRLARSVYLSAPRVQGE